MGKTKIFVWGVSICVFVLFIKVFTFEQTDYILDFERLELVHYDKTYIQSAHVITTKYNRTHPVVNATFTLAVNLNRELQAIAQAYTFLSNEYRLFPLHLGFNVCEAINNNGFGLASLGKYGNFTGCPIKKGYYCINNWSPDQSRFPPFIPNGRYMIEVLLQLIPSTEIGKIQVYGTVSRPLGRRH